MNEKGNEGTRSDFGENLPRRYHMSLAKYTFVCCATGGTLLRFDRAVLLRTIGQQSGRFESTLLGLQISVTEMARLDGNISVYCLKASRSCQKSFPGD
jgi:hypothetical protein